MGTVTTTVSHAAPYIREALIHEASNAENSKTQRDRQAHVAAMFAYGKALKIMRDAEDQTPAEGLPNAETLPIDGLRKTVDFFKDSIDQVLGKLAADEIREQLAAFEARQARIVIEEPARNVPDPHGTLDQIKATMTDRDEA